ncbi:peptide cleavage/export ABC transporter [Lactiplantibacillus plantarum]|uniref:peptide cleavage/export ABC transporter n=1 Tax=Lactiplantibacillus plantarum TaxID=1590 RepID=UPI001AAF4213|nr:peptide cleavage/export ABC transporter [Lactiplantibacillus plantarum]MBO2705798.1 peptide cleavage/export ABC transporter [Lactiplantibacillus plantarum]MDN7038268.1 peptide cleavage/export ABC transporter [Lactiplantibacillus plantarum]MDO7795360.1 peptide cleavage/export ABC transporter [Lactiplantibacillus plantarum]WVI00464.1 peptide cleavage/export ABC transporter [Lactiplantibacillus plantarum]
MTSFKYIQQLDETDCGAAALAMIFRYYNSDISITSIRNVSQTDRNGTTALGLVKAAEHFGFQAVGTQGNIDALKKNKSLQLPFLAHVDVDSGTLHYLVVLEIHDDYIKIADPNPVVKIRRMSYTEFEKIWTGVTVFITPASSYKPVKDNDDSLRSLLSLIFKQKYLVASILAASILLTFVTIASSLFIGKLIDWYIPQKELTELSIIVGGLLIAYVFYGIFNYSEGYLSVVLSQRISIDLMLGYIRHLYQLPVYAFNRWRTGELTSRFSDANNIIYMLASTVISSVLNAGTVILTGIVLCAMNVKMFLLACLAVPLYAILVVLFSPIYTRLNNNRMESGSQLTSYLIEDLKGMETIKSLHVEKNRYKLIDSQFVKLLKHNLRYENVTYIQESLKDVTNFVMSVVILYFGSILVVRGDISVGQLVAFNLLLGYFMKPLEDLINIQNNIQAARTAYMRLNQIFKSPIEVLEDKNGDTEAFEKKKPIIELSNVAFEYKYDQQVLDDISMSIFSGSSVAIVGLSGSGKSSLAKILAGFYAPTNGEIKLHGQNLTIASIKNLRNVVTYLPQSPYIFSGTVADNISLGARDEVSQERVEWAAKCAEIHTDILKFTDGYNTKLSSDGGLSGGQRQRISIARALLSDSPVIIFDESTSNLDTMTERKILENILNIAGKTMIFIAHRLNVAKKMENIFVVGNGRILEHGNHDELMENHGEYYRAWEG